MPILTMFSTPVATVLSISSSFMSRKIFLPLLREVAGKFQAAGKDQLVADLVEDDVVAERGDHLLGFAHRRNIQPDDQPLACVHAQIHPCQSSMGVQSHDKRRSARPKAVEIAAAAGLVAVARRSGAPPGGT